MKELKQKGNIERLEFNAIIGKDRVGFGGLQITPFQQAKTVVRLDAADNAEGGGVKINPSDFYEADFRMLTKSIVSPDNWKCVDFSTGNILKDALPLFNNNPVYTDHSTYSVKNAFGIVKSVWWDAASVTAEGVSVPAGINGKFSIDTTTPMGMQLARQIAIGAIFSVSVGIEFRWDASHVFENKWDWYDNIGVIQADGKCAAEFAQKSRMFLKSHWFTWGLTLTQKSLVRMEKLSIPTTAQ